MSKKGQPLTFDKVPDEQGKMGDIVFIGEEELKTGKNLPICYKVETVRKKEKDSEI